MLPALWIERLPTIILFPASANAAILRCIPETIGEITFGNAISSAPEKYFSGSIAKKESIEKCR
jgi:hypothetical protein